MDEERQRRWRLVLGDAAAPELPEGEAALGEADRAMDRALGGLYDGAPGDRKGGLGRSTPQLTRWLGDIRAFFPTEVVRVLQADAVDRLGLRQLLLEPELLAAQEPDVHLVATLLSLAQALPARTRETARDVVRRVVRQVEDRLRERVRAAVRGALDRASVTRRPRAGEIDWDRTIRLNLRRWDPERRRLVAELLRGRRRRGTGLRDVILLVDQSGSMAESVVYAGIFGAVMASVRSLRTRMVVFDTDVVDLTETVTDPVELLFAVQLGGGTDIRRALAYAQSVVTRPTDTIVVLISDLYDGGDADETVARAAALVASGVLVLVLLALSDAGAPAYDHRLADRLAALGIVSVACTPDAFPDLLARALRRAQPAR